jgi:hypothetical protein
MDVAEEHAPGRDWLAIISRPTLEEFGRVFPEAPAMKASVLEDPVVGAPGTRAFLEASWAIYDRISFTAEHRPASRTWPERRGDYRGLPLAGVTTLITGTDGAIAGVRVFHTPTDQQIALAADVQQRLAASDQGHIPCR